MLMTGFLYLGCAGLGIRLLFWLLGHWLKPLPLHQAEEAPADVPVLHPTRRPRGDYCADRE